MVGFRAQLILATVNVFRKFKTHAYGKIPDALRAILGASGKTKLVLIHFRTIVPQAEDG
jgi:hypothetical protein